MSMYEFDLTRGGKTRRIAVSNVIADFDGEAPQLRVCYQIKTEGRDSVQWRPLETVYPQAVPVFDNAALVAAFATIGNKTINTAAKFAELLNLLAETLAKQKWSN